MYAQAGVRPARGADASAVLELMAEFHAEHGLAIDAGWASHTFFGLLRHGSRGACWVVGDADGRLIGYALLGWGRRLGDKVCVRATIDELYVRPAERRRGRARDLLQVLRNLCREQGLMPMPWRADDHGAQLGQRLFALRPQPQAQPAVDPAIATPPAPSEGVPAQRERADEPHVLAA